MAVLLNTNETQIVRLAGAVFGVAPGYTYLNNFAEYAATYKVAGVAQQFIEISGLTNAQLAEVVVGNLGLTGAAATEGEAVVLSSLNAAGAAGRGQALTDLLNAFAKMTGDATYGAAATAWNEKIVSAYEYSVNAANTTTDLAVLADAYDRDAEPNDFVLTNGLDKFVGTTGDDSFSADLDDNSNTLESGDTLVGGAGEDSLDATLGLSSDFAITPNTTGIENVTIRVQSADANGSNSNNNMYTEQVTVDAERMQGVNYWSSENSRADLIVEDVRILDSQITKDITIAMVSTDPGHADFGVYFDQHSLRAGSLNTASQLSIQLRDGLAAADAPLGNLAVDGIRFTLDGATVTLRSDAIDAATTYDQLVAAVNAAIAATPAAAGLVASKGTTFDSVNGVAASGNYIILTDAEGRTFDAAGFTHSDKSTGKFTLLGNFDDTPADVIAEPVTATIILDDVGRGSMGGDLVVGGLSVGDTSTSKGVERFEITVERSSKLQSIDSTNNSLEEVQIVNGTTKGNLTVTGFVFDREGDGAVTVDNEAALPGSENQSTANAYGFTDVRELDASTMVGNVTLTAELTEAVAAKYMNRVDTATDINADNIQFEYTLGNGNDSLKLDISAANFNLPGAAARGDFELVVAGGNGNDTITTDIINPADDESAAATWYQNQHLNTAAGATLEVDGGAGNDTINTLGGGDFSITGGSGDDNIYTDNSGEKGRWVFNAIDGATDDDLVGLTLGAKAALYGAKLTLTLSGSDEIDTTVIAGDAAQYANGFESVVTIPTAGYLGNQGQVNQAIKEAINGNSVLNKLLQAVDGPDNTVIVQSKIDGVFVPTDIAVTITPVDYTKLTSAEQAGLKTALKLTDATDIQDALDGAAADFEALNANPQVIFEGTASEAASDNTIIGGTGDDVIVLSTGVDSNEVVKFVGYDLGKDTIVNFAATTATLVNNDDGAGDVIPSADVFDFTAYGVKSTADIFAAGDDVTDNGIAILSFAGTATENFAGLTAERLLFALNTAGDEGKDLYGEFDTDTLNAAPAAAGAGEVVTAAGVQNHVVLVENEANLGEYKLFHLTSATNTDGEFATAKLIGTIDLGNSLVA